MTIYDNPPKHLKTISSSQKKSRYELDYRKTLSSPKIRKNNEQFNSCYRGTLFDYCHSCVSVLYTIHYTIKCNSERERV